MDAQKSPWQKVAGLVPPDEVADWRMVLLYDAAVDNGVLDALPGSPAALAADLGLDAHAVRVVLDGLALWDIVVADGEGGYDLDPAAPQAEADFRRWFDQAGYRLVAMQQLRRRPEWLLFSSPANP